MSDDVARVAADVITERQRQIRQEGWSPEHDDEHTSGELAGAAACPKTQLPPEWPGVRGVRKTARASGGRNSGFRLATSIRCLRVLASLRLAPACEERRSPTI